MENEKLTWRAAWRHFADPIAPLSTREKSVLLVVTLLTGVTKLFARSKSLWDWDEALFSSALVDYDVTAHHPHPPGFPLFIALAKLARLFIPDDFAALQAIVGCAAVLLLPTLFFFARELRLGFVPSIAAATITSFLPAVVVYGGTAHSDIVALTLVLAANALLLRSCRDSNYFTRGAVLFALSIAVRPQNLLIGSAPLVLAAVHSWRRSPRRTSVALVAAASIVIVAYALAAVNSGGFTRYSDAVADHSRYVQQVDSFQNPDRAPLSELVENYFLTPTRSGVLDYVLTLLALVALVGSMRKLDPGIVIAVATFVPYQFFSWLMLDPNGHGRLGLGYIALYPILAAAGLAIVGKIVTPTRANQIVAVAALLFTMILAYRDVRLVAPLRETDSPPVAAAKWVRQNLPKASTLEVGQSLRPHFDYLLPDYRRLAPGETGATYLVTESGESDPSQIASFSRDRRHLWKVVRHSNFDVYVFRRSN